MTTTSATVRVRWRAEILRNPRVSNATRVLLLVMYDHMRDDGRVSVPRSKLAAVLEVNPARVTERVRQAVAADLLAVIESGRPGVTATYRALLPEATAAEQPRPKKVPRPHHTHGRYAEPSEGPPSAPPAHAQLGPPFGHPTEQPRDIDPNINDLLTRASRGRDLRQVRLDLQNADDPIRSVGKWVKSILDTEGPQAALTAITNRGDNGYRNRAANEGGLDPSMIHDTPYTTPTDDEPYTEKWNPS